MLGVIYQHSPLVLIMRTERPSDTIERLVEGPLMIEAHSGDLLAMLHRSGLSLDQLNIIERPDNALDLLENKEGISSISAYQTDEPYTLVNDNIPFITFTPRTYGVDFYGDNFFTTKAMVKERKDLVERFRSATILGWKEALRDPEKAISYILLETPYGFGREKLRYEARITQYLMTNLVEPGYMSTERWQHIAETFLQVGMLEKTPDLTGFILETGPPSLPKWFWPTIFSVLALLMVSMIIALYLNNLNIRLQLEIDLRMKAEKYLRESNQELILAREISEEANREKSWFIANVSHDLRTPISAMISLAQIFNHHSKTLQLPDKFQRFLKQLNSSGELLMLMLNNILDHSAFEMDAANNSPEPTDLEESCAGVVNLVQALADEKDISIQVELRGSGGSLLIDRTRLAQIFLNLLHNAVKFSPKGGTICFDLNHRSDLLEIEVRDQGPGIPPEAQQHVFEMFAKSDQGIARQPAKGLGLAIVKRNVELLNGSISVEQAAPKGAIFKVSIPLRSEAIPNPETD